MRWKPWKGVPKTPKCPVCGRKKTQIWGVQPFDGVKMFFIIVVRCQKCGHPFWYAAEE